MATISKTRINEYLANEFGVYDDHNDQPSESWPFQLKELGTLSTGTRVLEFADGDTEYFVLDGTSLTYLPKENFNLENLELQELGAKAIADQDPVDLRTSRIGDSFVPSVLERKAKFQELASHVSSTPELLEALYLRATGHYLALVRDSTTGRRFVIGSHLLPVECPIRELSSWRELSAQVGQLLTHGGAV
jgi:hypothetical protein